MTVDFDSISKDANRHPKLMSDTDVSNIRSIVDANPALFQLGWDQPNTKRRDSGVYFKKSIKAGVEVDNPKYAFLFFMATEIPQYTLFDGTVLDCSLFKYLDGTRALWFDADDPSTPEWELVHFQDEPPVLTPSIDAICQLAATVTGNTNTQPLREYLEILDNIETDRHDWSFGTLWISTKLKSIKLGLNKNEEAWVSSEVEGILDKVCGSKNSHAYKNSEQMFSTLGLTQVESPHSILTPHVEFDADGLKKELSFEMGTSYSYNAPYGSQPMDDFPVFNSYQSSYNDGKGMIINDSRDYNWISDDWREQLEVWEQCENIQATFGDVVVKATKDGLTTELLYGLSGAKTGQQPTTFKRLGDLDYSF